MRLHVTLTFLLAACGASTPPSEAPPPTRVETPPAPQATDVCSEGWCYESPRPAAGLQAVGVVRPGIALVVGRGGVAVLVSADPDEAMRVLDTGTTADLRDVAVVGTGRAWVVGDEGTMLFFDGARLTRVPVETDTDLHAVWASTELAVAVGEGGTVLVHEGERWRADSAGTDHTLRSVWASGARHIVAASFETAEDDETAETYNWGTLVTFDGERWTNEEQDSGVYDLFGVAGADEPATIFHRPDPSDSGMAGDGCFVDHDSLELLSTEGGSRCVAGWAASSTDVWVVGEVDADGAYAWHFDGEEWRAADEGVGELPVDVHGTSGDDVFVVSRDGIVSHFDGHAWTNLSGPGGQLSSLWMHEEERGFGMSSFGAVWLLQDGHWRRVTELDHSRAAWWSGPNEALVTGDRGRVVRWTPDGITEQPAAPERISWLFRAGFGPLLGASAEHVYTYDGSTFTALEVPGEPRLYERVEGDDVVFFLGARGLVRYDASGWREHALPDGMQPHALAGSAPDDLWLACDHGRVAHWNGSAFQVEDTGPDVRFHAIVAHEDLLVLAGRDRLVTRRDDGPWTPHALEEIPWDMAVLPDGTVVAAGNMGLLAWDGDAWRTLRRFAHLSLTSFQAQGGSVFAFSRTMPVLLRYRAQAR